ncbi:cytochrome aa3 quinol oxidase subunit II [Bacillus rubiinfantis]|uniref:cytochrome aa3 quinol oxidase subunit II n=2 Tax=Bacillaceae TaxID=186817 RepID=UPI0005AB31EE|nr:cytochrome aa3 quinol oxidase subunit II [Bacillus rubiinfantis]
MKLTNIKKFSLVSLMAVLIGVLSGCSENYIVLDPKGPVGETQLNLIILSTVILGVFIIPVLLFFFYVIFRYRDKKGNKASYKPEWDDNKWMEIVWWGIPVLVIVVLSIYTVRDTFALAKSPSPEVKPMTIQVTSLDWKWLFLYPEQGIATVNYAEIPTDRPVKFELTTDAPINSFWVPQLGGQKYTIPGKALELWLEAEAEGKYYGTANNFSGEGFTDMKFDVIAKSEKDFNSWVKEVKAGSNSLTMEGYEKLSNPGVVKKQEFTSYPKELFNYIINKNGGQYYKSNQQEENK